MYHARNIGYIIHLIAEKHNKKDELCNKLGFNEHDYNRLINGRLSITPNQLQLIADILLITPKEILNYRNKNGYSRLIHYRIPYKYQKNCDEILDIIDGYIDFAEVEINAWQTSVYMLSIYREIKKNISISSIFLLIGLLRKPFFN